MYFIDLRYTQSFLKIHPLHVLLSGKEVVCKAGVY